MALHELAHCLDYGLASVIAPEPEQVAIATAVLPTIATSPPTEVIPHSHCMRFIRASLHVAVRATVRGVEMPPGAVFDGDSYGLSSAATYLTALGDEPARCIDMLFSDLMATRFPPAFVDVWVADLCRLMQSDSCAVRSRPEGAGKYPHPDCR